MLIDWTPDVVTRRTGSRRRGGTRRTNANDVEGPGRGRVETKSYCVEEKGRYAPGVSGPSAGTGAPSTGSAAGLGSSSLAGAADSAPGSPSVLRGLAFRCSVLRTVVLGLA